MAARTVAQTDVAVGAEEAVTDIPKEALIYSVRGELVEPCTE
jgi:hypothetical protein